MSLDTSLFERRRPARQRRNSRSPEPRVPAARQGRTCARNAFGGCPCGCSLVCVRARGTLCVPERKCQATVQGEARTLLGAGACAHDSAGVCVRIRTRNACAFATARHTVAARKKMLHIDLCESERTACCGQHVCAGTVLVTACSARIYPAHLREINAGACACVSMSALCTCARVKGGWLAPIAMFRDADRVLPVLATVCLPRALILRLGRRGWPARNRLLR